MQTHSAHGRCFPAATIQIQNADCLAKQRAELSPIVQSGIGGEQIPGITRRRPGGPRAVVPPHDPRIVGEIGPNLRLAVSGKAVDRALQIRRKGSIRRKQNRADKTGHSIIPLAKSALRARAVDKARTTRFRLAGNIGRHNNMRRAPRPPRRQGARPFPPAFLHFDLIHGPPKILNRLRK